MSNGKCPEDSFVARFDPVPDVFKTERRYQLPLLFSSTSGNWVSFWGERELSGYD